MKKQNTCFLIFLNQNEWMKALPKPQKSTVTVPFLRKRSPVAVVNQPFAARFFPGEDPLGRRIQVGGADPEGPWLTVVGVAGDLDMDGAMDPGGNPEGVYLPLAQADVLNESARLALALHEAQQLDQY